MTGNRPTTDSADRSRSRPLLFLRGSSAVRIAPPRDRRRSTRVGEPEERRKKNSFANFEHRSVQRRRTSRVVLLVLYPRRTLVLSIILFSQTVVAKLFLTNSVELVVQIQLLNSSGFPLESGPPPYLPTYEERCYDVLTEQLEHSSKRPSPLLVLLRLPFSSPTRKDRFLPLQNESQSR